MSSELAKPFLMFAAGEEDRGDDGREIASRYHRRFLLPTFPSRWDARTDRPEEPRWHFPVEQAMCVRLVAELAESLGKPLKIVDVNRPEDDRDLVSQWLDANASLPVLVAPDGRRLERLESFVPARVRRFLAGP